MKIGIIGPCEVEIKPFLSRITVTETERYAKLDFHVGKYNGLDVVAVFCGICKVNAAIAAQILIDKFAVTHIILTGVSGAMDTRLNILDTVIASEAAYHDVESEIFTQYHPWMDSVCFPADNAMADGILKSAKGGPHEATIFTGSIVTGEAFITNEGRDEIIEKFDPMCVDMETAGVAHACYVNGIPFAAIRSMSDTAEESGEDAFERHVSAAAEKSVAVLAGYLDSISG